MLPAPPPFQPLAAPDGTPDDPTRAPPALWRRLRKDRLALGGAVLVLAFPVLLLGVALVAILTPGIPVIIGVIGLVSWSSMARIIHGQVLALRERDFVEAARAVGAGGGRILVRHILPHLISPIIVYSSLGVATAVLFEASLSYLGIGVQPPDPSWGKMVAEGAANQGAGGFAYPWLLLFPGAAVFCTVLSFNLLGDGLRDALDPHGR
ncbi:MAG: hypothetical protein NVSMB65_04450 [Chloroflexota bacterium]